MAERTTTFYRGEVGDSGVPVTGRICKSPQGQAGRDHPDQQGQVFAARHDIATQLGQSNPSPGHINSPNPRGPIGKSYHDKWLDEMTCYGRQFPDGSIVWDGLHAQWSGPATPQGSMGGAQGEPTHVSRGPKKG